MVDARGYSCPMPVVMVQKEVGRSAPDQLEVLVDDRCAVENISRFAGHSGYAVEIREVADDEFSLLLTKLP